MAHIDREKLLAHLATMHYGAQALGARIRAGEFDAEDSAKSESALEAYDALYKNPRTGEYIIDGDEAQVAADLAAVVRSAS